MGMLSRTKGKAGEREAAAEISKLTGWDCKRRVRQHEGDSDLLGVPGWCIEVKRVKTAPRHKLAEYWYQAVEEAKKEGAVNIPVLIYRADRQDWRAVWPASVQLVSQTAEMWDGYLWTVEGDLQVWAAVARDIHRG